MPIIQSAKKAAKQSLTRKIRNTRTRRALHDVQKEFYAFLDNNKKDEATTLLSKLYKTIDTASKKNIIPPNRASRLKSKAARYLAAA